MKCRRGDIVLVLFPESNLRDSKRRPALVVQADNLATGIAQVVVAMITTNMSRATHPSRVTIRIASDEGRRSGLRSDSVVLTDNIATAVEGLIERVIGNLSSMHVVDAALRHTLGL
jgi:mRNA interferase MazF